jgi:hypothetical protein
MNNKTYRSIFISDTHLGSKDAKAEQLNNFLKHNTCETLYLVGDILDIWKIQQNKWRWKQSHTNVVRRVLGHAKRGTPVAAYPVQGPEDVIDQGMTGFMDEKLEDAVTACLQLDREQVEKFSERWTWELAWKIFRDNLLSTKY